MTAWRSSPVRCSRRSRGGSSDSTAGCTCEVSVHAVTDTCSAPLNWRLFLPESWDDQKTDDPGQ
ncbi:transposase, partial [Kutzneria buriramensis]|uniref:transposase n=1 Tax=Kutzneria buriramensis TaxID=1045776 RepID=UPI0035F084F0